MTVPLILIPGMMCDARLFAPQIAAFSGRCTPMLAPITACETTGALAAEILAAAPARFALAGLSMGGIVAMEILQQAPDRVERIALLDTNPEAERPAVRAARQPQIEAVVRGHLEEVMRNEMMPRYLADGPRSAMILDTCMDMALDLGADVFVRQSRALMGRPDRKDVLRNAALPALILCGEEDTLCPPERHRIMHDLIVGSHLEIIQGAGHLPTLEQPELTNLALGRWLETT